MMNDEHSTIPERAIPITEIVVDNFSLSGAEI
jgi:hypothetical protein